MIDITKTAIYRICHTKDCEEINDILIEEYKESSRKATISCLKNELKEIKNFDILCASLGHPLDKKQSELLLDIINQMEQQLRTLEK